MSKSTANPVLEAALDYATRLGWFVFPLNPRTRKAYKSKKTSNGRRWGCTNDPEEIRKDFTKWKQASIGIALHESGLWVIDIDTPEGHPGRDGFTTMAALEAVHGKLPETRASESPTGSRHAYFRKPPEGMISNNHDGSKIGPGVDVKGHGGMVVAPPSRHKKAAGTYKWLNDAPVIDAPPWLLAMALNKERAKTRTSTDPEEMQEPGEREAAYARAALAGCVGDLAATGSARNDNLNKAAHRLGGMVARGWLDRATVEAALLGAMYANGYVAKDGIEETEATLRSGLDAGEQEPHPDLEDDQCRAEQVAENIRIGDDVTESIFPTIMTFAEMSDRLVFVGSSGAVVDRQTGRMRKREAAAAEYAASMHTIVSNGKKRNIPALKAWIESSNRVTVDTLAWWPGEADIFNPPEEFGGIALNTWQPLVPADAPDDWRERVKPFLEHVAYLVPTEAERRRFLQWLAHIVQHPEVLPHTGPI